MVTGVTTEVCVNTTVREANDRGYDCLVPSDCVGSYFPEFQEMGLKMIKAQGGIFGWVGESSSVIAALEGRANCHEGSRLMSASMTAGKSPKFWVPGDWNAFFGFGTNILVNVLVLTGLLRFVIKMPDALVFGRILPALGLMLLPQHGYYAWLAWRPGQAHRAGRRLRPAVRHQRAAHVRRHLRRHAADRHARPAIPSRPGRPA